MHPFKVRIRQSSGHINPLFSEIKAMYFNGYPPNVFYLVVGGDNRVTSGPIILCHLDTAFLKVDANVQPSSTDSVARLL